MEVVFKVMWNGNEIRRGVYRFGTVPLTAQPRSPDSREPTLPAVKAVDTTQLTVSDASRLSAPVAHFISHAVCLLMAAILTTK